MYTSEESHVFWVSKIQISMKKKRSKCSQLLMVRAEVADPPSPPRTVSLNVKCPIFFDAPTYSKNGPEGWVHITSTNTNLDQISSSENRPCINFKISTKQKLSFLTKPQLRNLQLTVANMILISSSNNIKKLIYTHTRVTSIKFTKQQSVSQLKGKQWSDSGPIKSGQNSPLFREAPFLNVLTS